VRTLDTRGPHVAGVVVFAIPGAPGTRNRGNGGENGPASDGAPRGTFLGTCIRTGRMHRKFFAGYISTELRGEIGFHPEWLWGCGVGHVRQVGGTGPVMAVRPSVLVGDVLPAVPPADPSVGWSH
jgi:hypothetical protein